MNLLVTGGAGFIGSYLCEKLLAMGHSVTSIDDFSTGSKENLSSIINNPNFRSVEGSIVDRNLVDDLVRDSDGCFHMAAAVGVKKILDDPIGSLETNLDGSHNVIKASALHRKRLLLASTSEIYGKNPLQPLKEDSDRVIGSPLLSRWTYSEAKAIDEALARAYFERDKLQVQIVRLFNTVGPRQSPAYGMVIPRFFEAAIKNKDLQIHGDGSQKRVFCHVADAVSGILSLWGTDQGMGEAFNVGGIEEISIKELANKVIDLTRSKSKLSYISYDELKIKGFEDMARRIPDTEKLQRITSWKPHFSLDQILDDYKQFIGSKE
jgi:UDP-glucose 4-epimerase